MVVVAEYDGHDGVDDDAADGDVAGGGCCCLLSWPQFVAEDALELTMMMAATIVWVVAECGFRIVVILVLTIAVPVVDDADGGGGGGGAVVAVWWHLDQRDDAGNLEYYNVVVVAVMVVEMSPTPTPTTSPMPMPQLPTIHHATVLLHSCTHAFPSDLSSSFAL